MDRAAHPIDVEHRGTTRQAPTEQTISAAAAARLRALNAKNAAKAVLQRAWRNVSPEYHAARFGLLADRSNNPTDRYTRCLRLSDTHSAPIWWLVEVDEQEFESAVKEMRVERAAREKANWGQR